MLINLSQRNKHPELFNCKLLLKYRVFHTQHNSNDQISSKWILRSKIKKDQSFVFSIVTQG